MKTDFKIAVSAEIADWCDKNRNFQLISEDDVIHITEIETDKCWVHYEYQDGVYDESGLIPYSLVEHLIPDKYK